jgi:enamine deaminase RidA (YjgF/YER057c/UK114 family)
VRFGDILFVSGLTPLDENARLVGEDDVVAQARQVHLNLEKVLTHAGASFADVLKVTVFLINICAVTGWHRHRHRPGPTLLVDTTSDQ